MSEAKKVVTSVHKKGTSSVTMRNHQRLAFYATGDIFIYLRLIFGHVARLLHCAFGRQLNNEGCLWHWHRPGAKYGRHAPPAQYILHTNTYKEPDVGEEFRTYGLRRVKA